MKTLPYFRWYPADAETDDFYADLSNEELGCYHRLLNRAWINDGIPCDPEKIRRMLHLSPKKMNEIWEKIGIKFVISPRDFSKLVNQRQEEEFQLALSKSLANQRIGNANALRTRSSKNANAPQRALAGAESDSCVRFSSSGGVQRGESKPPNPAAPASDAGTVLCARRFDDWMSQWPRNPNNEQAVHAWAFCWTAEEDPQIFACRDRYLASADAKAGVFQNPAKFLNEQRANGWAGKWPPPAEAEKNGYHSHEIDYPDLGGPR